MMYIDVSSGLIQTIIRACALSRTTQKRDSRVSSFNVGTIIWPDGDLGETIGAKATEDALNVSDNT